MLLLVLAVLAHDPNSAGEKSFRFGHLNVFAAFYSVGTFDAVSELRFHFDSRKSAQAAAYILRLAGGDISKGRLIKMLYAADRRQLKRVGQPITGDQPASLPHGPVLSHILNLLNGDRTDAYWKKHISTAAAETHLVRLLADVPTDLLTENEQESLKEAFDFLKKYSWSELVQFCHERFKEWQDPKGSSAPIKFETILQAAGKDASFIDAIKSQQAEDELLRRLA